MCFGSCGYREDQDSGQGEYSLRVHVPSLLRAMQVSRTMHAQIRRTNVQDGEAGGITQQIVAMFVPQEAIRGQNRAPEGGGCGGGVRGMHVQVQAGSWLWGL